MGYLLLYTIPKHFCMKTYLYLLSLITAGLFACNNNTADQQAGNTGSPGTGTDPVARFNIQPLDAAALPATIKFKGNLYQAWQWQDSLGENLLITSQVAPAYSTKTGEEEGASASLHAFHYVKKTGEYQLRWQMHDSVEDCPVDVSCNYIDSVHITDLDGNGIAETSLLYKTACRGDISPAYMKLIMHQDSVKYALRGNMWVKTNTEDSFTVNPSNVNLETLPRADSEYGRLLQQDGRYENEKDFKTAPPAFLSFARELWLKKTVETFDQTE